MKCILVAATIGAVWSALLTAGAQAQTQPTAPAAPAASAPSTAPPPAKPARAKSAPSRADARVCLEFPTNLQVIKCSEKYRYAKAPA